MISFRFNGSTIQRITWRQPALHERPIKREAKVRRHADQTSEVISFRFNDSIRRWTNPPWRAAHHGVGRGCGVGRDLGNGVNLGVIVAVGLGVTVEVGVGVTVGLGVGVGLGKHALSTSTKRATTCWFPCSVVCTPVTRKPPSFLLATTEPRAKNWVVPSKTFTASPSRSPSEDRSCTQTMLVFGSIHLTR